ncbi:hypothetical protein VCHA38P217_160009 [Vibrio chagasii]|nr:hypothetical protein VCHA34P120_20077 [Vibrio chagasii]CAH7025888.1 hypothetical protein VCHA41O246_180077 [Vibrio chagasii]CAH7170036.1 hypothetical protein VCHA38P217_160009 [Vibrio chagasii]CAH7458200.1 hypothetical protein VCHA42O253_30273 [Vibrio chagasii]
MFQALTAETPTIPKLSTSTFESTGLNTLFGKLRFVLPVPMNMRRLKIFNLSITKSRLSLAISSMFNVTSAQIYKNRAPIVYKRQQFKCLFSGYLHTFYYLLTKVTHLKSDSATLLN